MEFRPRRQGETAENEKKSEIPRIEMENVKDAGSGVVLGTPNFNSDFVFWRSFVGGLNTLTDEKGGGKGILVGLGFAKYNAFLETVPERDATPFSQKA